ncbi:MAG: DUF192 domain-containing protein [Terracidiphilus sp.]
MESLQHCAYNQTRNRFLSLDVFAGDFSFAILDDWIAKLTPDSGAGLWLVPFRGIPATGARLPLDLVYLDEDSRVVAIVEKFPTFCVSPTSPTAASVLALPHGSISSTGTQPGDELMVCTGEEMRWHIGMFSDASAVSEADPGAVQGAVIPNEGSSACPASGLLQAEDPSNEHNRSKRNWLERWLFPNPPDQDKRTAPRKPTPRFTAHFWTGGAPQAHTIRDISATGLYVVTQERWYLGTQIRLTLTKTGAGEPCAESSITVQAIAVRWGNDGVGLEFILHDPRNLRRRQSLPSDGGDRVQLERFLERFKGGNCERTE